MQDSLFVEPDIVLGLVPQSRQQNASFRGVNCDLSNQLVKRIQIQFSCIDTVAEDFGPCNPYFLWLNVSSRIDAQFSTGFSSGWNPSALKSLGMWSLNSRSKISFNCSLLLFSSERLAWEIFCYHCFIIIFFNTLEIALIILYSNLIVSNLSNPTSRIMPIIFNNIIYCDSKYLTLIFC